MSSSLVAQVDTLRHLMRTAPNPRVRRRAHALVLIGEGRSVARAARVFLTAPVRVRSWRQRFLEQGSEGLVDRPRSGRPRKLTTKDLALLKEAISKGPQEYDLVTTVWTVRDLCQLLTSQHGVQVSTATVHRALLRMGYRYRRPRHDLKHRQNAEAVASARQVLDWLKKSHPQTLEGFDWSTWTNAKSTFIPVWRRSGRSEETP